MHYFHQGAKQLFLHNVVQLIIETVIVAIISLLQGVYPCKQSVILFLRCIIIKVMDLPWIPIAGSVNPCYMGDRIIVSNTKSHNHAYACLAFALTISNSDRCAITAVGKRWRSG